MKFKYTELKESYLEVKKFLEYNSSMKVENLKTKIVDDLGLWGDDNLFLLEDFSNKYDVNFDRFDYNEHFDSEGDFISFKTFILGILKLPLLIINSLFIKNISIKTYDKIDKTLYDRTTQKKDLTFGDLILCKLNGEFVLRENCKIGLTK